MSKRILSLVLALVMVLGTFGTVFAADTVQKDAAEFLAEAKVLLGDDKGNLNLDLKLERRDMVVLLSRLMGDEEVASKFPVSEESPTWEDARTDAYYVPFFAWAQVNKFFAGKTVKEFGPREAITAQDYAVVLLRALGYDVEGHDAWKAALADAKKLGILANVEVEDATEITRGQMSVMTLNALAVNVKDSTKTLAETLEIKLPTPKVLAVEEVVADNLMEVKISFNKDVDADLTDIELYSIKGLTITDASVEDDMVILSLKEKMTNKKAYELVIKRTAEVDGTYKFVANDNAIPHVVAVQALGTKAIKVTLSEPVQKVSSTDFKLDGKTVYAGVPTHTGKEIVLRPYTELSLGEHELTVKGLKDYNNFISLETTHTFEVAEDKDAPKVVEVSATLERVVIEFSEDVDPNTVNTNTVHWLDSGVKRYADAGSVEQLAGNKYAFGFTKYPLPVYETTLYVSEVKDYSGNKMAADELKVKAVIDETRPEVVSVDLDTDLKTVIVKFNKPVNKTAEKNGALNRDNYTILDEKDNKVLINTIAEDGTSGKVFKITLSAKLAGNKAYTMKISKIQDNNKYANTMYDYVGNITVGVVGLPKVEKVTGTHFLVSGTTDTYRNSINVLFSRAMDLSTIADPANYLVRINGVVRPLTDVDGEIGVLNNDGTLITITAEGKDLKKITDLAVLGVKDINGKSLENYGELLPIGTIVPKLVDDADKPVVAVAKDKIKLKFDQPIATAPISAFSGVTVEKVEGLDTKTLTLTLGTDLSAHVGVSLTIADEELVSVLGGKLAVVTKPILDEIAPTFLDTATSEVVSTNNDVTITLKFDENLESIAGFNLAAKKDIKVIRVLDGKEVKDTDYDLIQDATRTELKIVIADEKHDSEYEVSIKADSDWLVDDTEGNSVEAKTRRTKRVTGSASIDQRNLEAATLAVQNFETSKLATDKVLAQTAVDLMLDGAAKTALQARIDAVVVVTP